MPDFAVTTVQIFKIADQQKKTPRILKSRSLLNRANQTIAGAISDKSETSDIKKVMVVKLSMFKNKKESDKPQGLFAIKACLTLVWAWHTISESHFRISKLPYFIQVISIC